MNDGELYDQMDGVAMGSPLGPTLANIFMCALEKRYLNDCPTQFKPVLYRRYVDDTFCLFNRRDDVDRFLQHINSFTQILNSLSRSRKKHIAIFGCSCQKGISLFFHQSL